MSVDKNWKITYSSKGMEVTCYGTKHEIEDLADHLENKGITFKIKSPENPQSIQGAV